MPQVGTPISTSTTAGTLGGIRYNVVTDSGRHDLVADYTNADYADNGCDRFINEAQRALDRLFPYKGERAWLYKALSADESHITFNRARYISEVWIANSTGRTKLQRKPLSWLRENYSSVPVTDLDSGTPLYWCPLVPGLAPQQYSETETTLGDSGLVDLQYLNYGNYYITDGVLIFPPTDTASTVEVLARWFSKSLTNDSDVSFWTVNEPGLLEDYTRLLFEEKIHRNSEGAQDVLIPIMRRLQQIYHDMVSEEVSYDAYHMRMI